MLQPRLQPVPTSKHTLRRRVRNACGFLVEREHDAVGDEGLEGLHLPFERFPVSDRDTISAQALEHCYSGDRQPPEISEVRQRLFADVRIPPAQLGQRVGIEHGRLTAHRLSVPAPRACG